jgi:hypothetical protein
VSIETSEARGGLRLLHAGILQAGKLALRAAIQAAEESAKHTTLYRDQTGATRASVRGEVEGYRGFVECGGASRLLDSGTQPHIIRAHGTALRFVVNGSVLYRAMVHHPGTAERPFVRQARDLGEQALDHGLVFFVNYAIARA